MGGGQYKKSPCGDIFVQLHQNQANIGQIVKGDVFLNVHTVGFPGNTIFLIFKQDSGEQVAEISETHKIFNKKCILTTFGDGLNPGQYQFPFQIPLNQITCTSVNFKTYLMAVKIQFFVKAQVQANPKIKLDSKIKHKVELYVNRSFQNIERPFKTAQDIKCKSCCCLDKGTIQIQPHLNQTDFCYGQIVPVQFTIDNSQSKLKIIRILVSVVMIFKGKIYGSTYHSTYKYQDIESPGMNVEQKELREVKVPLIDKEIDEKYNTKYQTTSFTPFAEHKHYIRIQLETNGCDCKLQDKQLKIPITIVVPFQQMNVQQNVDKPNDWNPQRSKEFVFESPKQEIQPFIMQNLWSDQQQNQNQINNNNQNPYEMQQFPQNDQNMDTEKFNQNN